MRTAAKLVLIGSVAAALGVALWKRRRISSAAQSAAVTTAIVAKKAADVVRSAVGSYGSIPGSVVKRFVQYGIPGMIDKYAGGFPWALAAAIIELESGGDPTRENKSGATGLVQILGGRNSRGLSKEQRLDPDVSLRTILPEWRNFLQMAKNAGVTDPTELFAYVYFAHNGGIGALQVALKHASEGFDKAVAYFRNMPWVKPSAKVDPEAHERNIDTLIRKRIAVARRVAAHALAWATIEGQVKGGNLAGALGAFVVEIDEPVVVYDMYGRPGVVHAVYERAA